LGNLYGIVEDSAKRAIVREWIHHQRPLTVIDSAGKYGAGLALESIGRFLGELGVAPDTVRISNKLGWKRVRLKGPEPTFEKGVWFGLEHDAEQDISYQGILDCWEQGNQLLGQYPARLLSVHDPDEYLAGAENADDEQGRYADILGAYRALAELKNEGQAEGIGVGSKDWRIIQRLFEDGVRLDWVMFANSFTLLTHPPEVQTFMEDLDRNGVSIINSAVFNAGFLIGGRYFDYEPVDETGRPELFRWRREFYDICDDFGVSPALACCQFALAPPAVKALALNTSRPERVADNVAMVQEALPGAFWEALKARQLIRANYPYL
jgi:D-threo-aldose 1-dehydrogenase